MPTNPRTDPTRLHATTQKKTQENPVQLILGHYTSAMERVPTAPAGRCCGNAVSYPEDIFGRRSSADPTKVRTLFTASHLFPGGVRWNERLVWEGPRRLRLPETLSFGGRTSQGLIRDGVKPVLTTRGGTRPYRGRASLARGRDAFHSVPFVPWWRAKSAMTINLPARRWIA